MKDDELKASQKANYDTHHGARTLTDLQEGDHVWIPDLLEQGTVASPAATPRSYHVETPRGTLRRNRRHLVPTTPAAPDPPRMALNEGATPSVQGSLSPQKPPARARRPPAFMKDYVT